VEVDVEEGEAAMGPEACGHSSDVMTRLVTALNWAMVARTVGARPGFSFLSRWDHTQPRQWNGTTWTNRPCTGPHRGRVSMCVCVCVCKGNTIATHSPRPI